MISVRARQRGRMARLGLHVKQGAPSLPDLRAELLSFRPASTMTRSMRLAWWDNCSI